MSYPCSGDTAKQGAAYTDEHAPEMLSRTVREEVALLRVGMPLDRVEDDAGLENDDFRVEGSRFKGSNNTLTLDEVTYRCTERKRSATL